MAQQHSSRRADEATALRQVGRRLAAAREAKGLTQDDLSRAIGRAVNSISRWENGTQEMGVLDAVAACKALQTPVASLLLGDSLPALRTGFVHFVRPGRLQAVQTASTAAALAAILELQPTAGVIVEPGDVEVSAEQWAETSSAIAAAWHEKVPAAMRRLLARISHK